jgi:peptidoglycan/LPS O-acetylase OafA/YrhL
LSIELTQAEPGGGSLSSGGRKGWRLDVQGMRGLTMLVIVLYHADLYIPGGFVSLDAFFVISGFVITGMILRERERNLSFSLVNFYIRRIKRLTPALLVTVIGVLILSIFFVSPIEVQDNTAYTGIGAVFFSANAVVQLTTGDYFGPWSELNPLMHVWSLSLEEQFYLVFPLILTFGWWIGARRKMPAAQLLTAAVFGISLWFALFGVSALPNINPAVFGYFSPVGRTWEFAAGSLLAFATQRGLRLSFAQSTFIGIIGLILFFAPMWLIDSSVQYPGPWTLAPVSATLLLIIAGFHAANPISRSLASKVMVYTGDRSYSWYLWHWPIIVFSLVAFPGIWGIGVVGAVLSIGPALLLYRFVESRSREAKWSVGMIFARTGLLAVATLLVAGSVLIGAKYGWWNEHITVAQTELLADHAAKANGCHLNQPIEAAAYDNCWLQPEGSGIAVSLVGDSNADHLSDAVVGAGAKLGRPVNVVSASSCPFIVSKGAAGLIDDRCQSYIDSTITWLADQEPMTVIISTSGTLYTVEGSQLLIDTVEAVKSLGHEVAIVKPVPFFVSPAFLRGGWDPSACTPVSLAMGDCRDVMTINEVRANQGAVWEAVDNATKVPGAFSIDLSPELCPSGVCATNPDGRWAYRDFNHITVSESQRLAGTVAQLLGSGERESGF